MRQVKSLGILWALVMTMFVLWAQPVWADIIMYYDTTTYQGNLGGRTSADTKCSSFASKPAGYNNYRAFISVSDTDEIRDMPTNYGVPTNQVIKGVNGGVTTTITNNWADLLDGSILATLQTAIDVGDNYWTGSCHFSHYFD